ncbi:MAG TPA: zf-TFIIB domain-containing protein [Thermoanaerobaculia bacterium]|jgi:Zn-finger nucleic acid-binding protein
MKRLCPKTGDELTPMPRGAFKCSGCGGMFLPRLIVELVHEELTTPAASESTAAIDAQTGRCPIDRSIMSRAEIELEKGQPPIHLERCSICHGVWFDAGEWSALAERQLLERLDEFWTAEWRARQRNEREEASHDRRLREAFGPELYDALQSIAAKIKGHERRSQALAFIRERSEE